MHAELYKRDGVAYRKIELCFSTNDLKMTTVDMGASSVMVVGREHYRFWVSIDRQDWGTLCAALITEYLGGDAEATDKLDDICARHGVRRTWDSEV